MSVSPTISVVIPLYNQAENIVATVESVLAQTLPATQVIVVDDGSTDDPTPHLQSFVDAGRITLVQQTNQGVTTARNRGLQDVSGDFVIFLDADDLWRPAFLERIAGLVDAYPDCSVFATSYAILDAQGGQREPLFRAFPSEGRDFVFTNYFEAASVSTPPLWTGAVVMRTEAIRAIGGFRECYHDGEDLLAWAELYTRTDIAFTRDVVSIYRQTSFSWTHYRRAASEIDITGNRLVELLNDPTIPENKKIGLRHYIALWKKIRASQWIRNGRPMRAWMSAFESIRYNSFNWKVYAYFPFAVIPESLRDRLVTVAEKRLNKEQGRI